MGGAGAQGTGRRRTLPVRRRGGCDQFLQSRGHRAIGVVYNPQYERFQYVPTELARRYDAFVHLEETRALHPLHIEASREAEPPDTYPWGF
ncbi:erythromycin esterase family protein [Microbulbifer taiwanensis]|uniref:erythromycin esterase family protein n=1 Tax=Microbulbifer taiwanensis TaxID=986746 RepID=UPI0036186E26